MSNLEGYVKENLQTFGLLKDSVKKEIEKMLRFKKSSITALVNRCESPIEQILAIQLIDMEEHLYRELAVLTDFKSLFTSPQKEVIANGRKYRLDFLIECQMKGKTHKFAIECDGHDFHEKTKEQAARDKSRERNLMQEGHTVIRFTGSEIWSNPLKCSGEIIKIISKEVGLDEYYEKLFDGEF